MKLSYRVLMGAWAIAGAATAHAEPASGVITFVGSVAVPACVLSVHTEHNPPVAAASGGQATCSAQPGAPVTAYFSSPARASAHQHVVKLAEAIRKDATIYVVEYQ